MLVSFSTKLFNRGGRYLSILPPLFLLSCTTPAPETEQPLDEYEELRPATMLEAPEVATDSDSEVTGRGKYMVELLGCGTCHTDGALVGEPRGTHLLAGSSVGLAYSNPLVTELPGVVFPANLTPDKETGIGNWNKEQLIAMIRTGTDVHGVQQLPVMPWPAYARISDEDAEAIAIYLMSLQPVRHQVPERVYPGQLTMEPYVHFGVYQNRSE